MSEPRIVREYHNPEYYFKCTVCGSVFKYLESAQEHMMIYHKMTPFEAGKALDLLSEENEFNPSRR